MKALTLSLCILALLGSGASGYFWWSIGNTKVELQSQLDGERARATSLQSNLNETNEKLEQKEAQLTETDAALGDAKRGLTAAEARNVQAAREIDALKRSVAAKEASERALTEDLETMRRQLVQARLASQVGNPEEVARYQSTISALETRLAELTGAPISASGSTAAPAGPVLSERTAAARVAQIGAQSAFVVLELGVDDGIRAGHRFAITRGGKTIADSVISDVKATYAIAHVTPASVRSELRIGDVASIRN